MAFFEINYSKISSPLPQRPLFRFLPFCFPWVETVIRNVPRQRARTELAPGSPGADGWNVSKDLEMCAAIRIVSNRQCRNEIQVCMSDGGVHKAKVMCQLAGV
ncbi:hypothetical protein CDAR_48881 [Caerostris darwini]|uniref:Uncharacterized protein n=1 Tax=Caerostris darwini TaxID=1538125 RepID=A0AAV4NK20_9ARAC|nr:hypothetical protein CDAR_48881 [Caerostris darwini]